MSRSNSDQDGVRNRTACVLEKILYQTASVLPRHERLIRKILYIPRYFGKKSIKTNMDVTMDRDHTSENRCKEALV